MHHLVSARRTRLARSVGRGVALAAASLLALGSTAAAQDASPAAPGCPYGASAGSQAADATVTITHGPVEATLVDAPPEGASVGDVRYFSVTAADEAGRTGRLTASLTTSSVGFPSAGDELRIAQLVVAFGDDLSDQLVIGGIAAYPKDASTIKPDSATIRPVVGGSGMWAGARGWAESFHLADGTWKHVFHLFLP